MKISNIFLSYLVLATILVVGYCGAEDAVVVLTNDTMDSVLDEHELVLVMFYAPWCVHCKQLAPTYEVAATKLKEKNVGVVLAKVDATTETKLADKYGIKGYPTLKFFRKKVSSAYTGGRTEEKIIEWVEMMMGPPVIIVEGDVKEAIKDIDGTVFVGEFKSADSELYMLYQSVAEENRQQSKFYSSFGESNSEKIYSVRPDEDGSQFQGNGTEELNKFVTEEWFPHFGAINGDNFKNYADRELDIVWFCGEKEHYEGNKTAIREVAKKLRSEYSFVWLDTEQYKSHAEGALGITEFPGLVYQSKKGRYVFSGSVDNIESSKLGAFFDDVKEGKIEKSIKSEPIPEQNDAPVKVVVAKQFEEMVLRKDKDVFLEIYAPWCGHCKNFEPIYAEFADKLKDIEHVVVAKMDGTANESPLEEFEWAGFPTILFVKAGEKVPIRYEYGRTVEDLFKFLKEKSSKPVEPPSSAEREEL